MTAAIFILVNLIEPFYLQYSSHTDGHNSRYVDTTAILRTRSSAEGLEGQAFCLKEVSASRNFRKERCWRHSTLRSSTPTKPRKISESRSTGCVTTGTSHLWTDFPSTRTRRRKSILLGRARPVNAQRPGNRASQYQELPRG